MYEYDASDALCSLRWMLVCCGHYHRRLQGAVCSCRLPIVLLQHCLLRYAVTALSNSDDLGDLGWQGHLWQCHCVVHFSFLQLDSWAFFCSCQVYRYRLLIYPRVAASSTIWSFSLCSGLPIFSPRSLYVVSLLNAVTHSIWWPGENWVSSRKHKVLDFRSLLDASFVITSYFSMHAYKLLGSENLVSCDA
jgi:hypothetical protein